MTPRRVNNFDPDGFASFWEHYPRHEGKLDAQKAWGQLQPNIETQQQIYNALVWQKAQRQWQESKQFIPLPASYLRGERWTDEPPATQQRIPTHRLTPFEQARRAGLK